MSFKVISPDSSEKLLELIVQYQSHKYRFGAGYTDLLLELEKRPDEEITVINLAYLNDALFTSIDTSPSRNEKTGLQDEYSTRIGALVTANRIASDRELQKRFPVLCNAAKKLASGQIRQTATVGGNLCTASPAGDIACSLVALEAHVDIVSGCGETRVIPINDFFIAVRNTDLKKDEVLRSVYIPSSQNKGINIYSDYIKIGTRRSMECSVVSFAYHIQTDKKDVITKAGAAIGSAAPTIRFVHSACEYITGKKVSSISPSEAEEFANRIMESAAPISDIRASAWYRNEVLHNISKSIFNK